ncbi:hypothetical protein NW768_004089 [Fusarium equiseti]|uniref:Uncharacterized protein n=1 Tax=Fusarium equiseti TaxID=61235 RepID=A0ABQ8RJH0_FUSEQ|nr:hypothetical protein NW768_004089 [Fusarium equiseti]
MAYTPFNPTAQPFYRPHCNIEPGQILPPQPFHQPHGNNQPGQIFPAQNTHPAQNIHPAHIHPAPVPPSGPARAYRNMHRQNRNSSGPHPTVNSTTNTTQDTSQSRSSDIPRDNNPGPSSQQNQNSSGPHPKVNNATNTTQNSGEPRSSDISQNNKAGPPSSRLTLVNNVHLEYIWFTDPADSKDCESIRVSRGMENNVGCQAPGLDYVWVATVDNLQAVMDMYRFTPGDKASIIMAKHVVDDRATQRLDWSLFKESLGPVS